MLICRQDGKVLDATELFTIHAGCGPRVFWKTGREEI